MDDSRRSILEGLDQLSIDADRNRSGFLRVPAHQKLGSEDYWIVVGARGMGKTTLANV
jgi:ABC-type molybdenum transport system ATPase subunit/photorepair protein PhrA